MIVTTSRADKANWARMRVRCEPCGTDVARSHLARHQKTKGHIARSAYKVLPSDEAFTKFLSEVRWENLNGFERRVYQRGQAEKLEMSA